MFRLRRTDRDVSTWHPGINVLLRETPPYINRDHLPLNEEVEPMMRGCAWTIGVIVVVVVALGILGSFAPEEAKKAEPRSHEAGLPGKGCRRVRRLGCRFYL